MNNKKIGSLLIFIVAIIGAIKLIQKPEPRLEESPIEISKDVNTMVNSVSPETSVLGQTNEALSKPINKQPVITEEPKKPQSKFLSQSGDEALAAFQQEEILDAGWAYTQEQFIHNLITQEIYPNEGIKVADEVKVECKSTSCLLTTKLESFEQVEKFYSALLQYSDEKGYQFNPIKMSPNETVFALYPPKP